MNKKIESKLKAVLYAVLFCLFVGLIGVLPHSDVSATSSTNYSGVIKKALLSGVNRCYVGGAIKSNAGTISQFSGFGSLIIGGDSSSYVALPSGLTNVTDNNVSCRGLFLGDISGSGESGTFEGLFALSGKQSTPSGEAKVGLLEGMGYKTGGSSSNKQCISFTLNEKSSYSTNSYPVSTDQICATIGSNGRIESLSVNSSTNSSSASSYSGLPSFFAVNSNGRIETVRLRKNVGAGGYDVWQTITTNKGVGDTWADFSADLRSELSSDGGPWQYSSSVQYGGTYTYSLPGGTTDGNYTESNLGDASYSITNMSTASSDAINYLSNGEFSGYSYGLKFSDEEKISLLIASIKEVFYPGMSADSYWKCGVSDWSDYGNYPASNAINVSASGTVASGCRLASTAKTGTIYGFSGNHFDSTGSTSYDLAGALAEINRLARNLPNGSTIDVNGGGENNGTVDAGEASTISPCYEGSGALGWIICPVLEAVGAATEWMYDNAVEPLLQIRADTLFSGTDGIYVGWSTFRNFSNILFAIAFAVIILAQVTGIGISNYNIKKILPRFVVVVVLVNISYILCQLAVDISNILGFSIRELFDRLPVPGVKATGGEMVVAILNGLGLAAGVGVGVNAALSSVVVVSTLKYFMVPLVLAFVGCLLGVLFFFITMSVRQTGIVILVVLAPVAIVCYALPNTKSLFDKWRKLFTALLMVYPICGLLMGGGNYVSALLLGAISGSQEGMGTLYTITALLVSILPFFLIPSLVKGSMAMMGNLGMKISNFGNGISRGLKSGVMNSRAVQERQAEQKRRLSIAQDQTKRNRIQGRISENSFRNRARALIGRAPRTELTNREATRLARAQAGINRATSETSAALEQTWANDGTSNDFDAMKNILLTSAEAYAKDENNFEALERMNAAMRTLSGTEPGQDVIYSTFNQMEANAAQNLDEKGRIKTQRALRKMSNDLMAMSGDKIKKDAPILMRKMKNYQKMETNGNINTSYLYDNRSATGGLADLKEVASSTADLSPATMPGVNESTLQTYIDAISSGRFDRGSTEYNNVTTAARRALTDPHIKGQVKGKVATLLQQLANMDYVGTASGTAAATGSVARASEAELSRIQSGLRDMRERPDATSEPHRQQMLNTLEQTMLRGTVSNDGDEFSLSPSNATQIDKILKENGINVTERFQSGVYDVDGSPVRNMSPDQFNQRYESMMGLKIDHSDRPASSSNLGSDSTSQAQTQPERPIIQADGDQNMERIREIARENLGPRQRDSQSGPRRNGQNGNIGNNDNPPTIFT